MKKKKLETAFFLVGRRVLAIQVQNTKSLKEDKPHGSASFRCAFYEAEQSESLFLVKHHWHDEIELLHFKKGNFHMEINMESYEITEECFFFVNPGELHYITSNGLCEEDAVVFNPYVLSFNSYDTMQNQVIQPLINGNLSLPRSINASLKEFQDIYREYEQIQKAFSMMEDTGEKPGQKNVSVSVSQMLIKASLLRILAILTGQGLLTRQENGVNHQVESIKTVLTYIRENYRDRIYIRDLAGLINVNEQYFCRFFRRAIGKTPMEYVNEIRIRRAAEMVISTDNLIMDICLDCGFNNLGNFLREFKKYTGTTPRLYKKENRSSFANEMK
ncbi:AraC family transcriptional regulator [Robinsoniella peoriensis]|uniref:AraC family transcriptional regulator n=1 Tax=Robinsoniella peoriensis TaxID=180332 RepID=UPI000AC7DF28